MPVIVSTLTQRERRVRPLRRIACVYAGMCFNPHPARTPGATPPDSAAIEPANVSTLTQRERRVRHRIGAAARSDRSDVSTLTQRERRVRQQDQYTAAYGGLFQPSPSANAGCDSTSNI